MSFIDLLRNIKNAVSQKLKEGPQAKTSIVNVNKNERVASLAGGLLLWYLVLRKVKAKSLITSITGGALIYRGVSGFCPVNKVLNRTSTSHQEKSRKNILTKEKSFNRKNVNDMLNKQSQPIK